jgi:hypothetical protein
MFDQLYRLSLSAIILMGLVAGASGQTWQFHSPLSDGYVYTKPATDLDGHWKEEFGIGAPLLTGGPWLFKWNAAYVHNFPNAFNVAPAWTAGVTAVYELAQGKVIPGLYTKTKNNLLGLWQQESGFTALTSVYNVGLVFSAGYIYSYPFKSDAGPLWQVSLSAQLKFK